MSEKSNLLLVGCGDLPNRLVEKLNLSDWAITGLRRSQISLKGAKMVFGDATDHQTIEKLLQRKPDQLIICLTPDSRGAEAYKDTYLKPAQLISQMAHEWAPMCHLIFVSSTSVYGQNSGELVDENSETEPARETAQVLLEAENHIAQSGNPWSVLRFSGIYGPGRERLINKIRDADFADAQEACWTNRIHSDDCASLLAYLLRCFRDSNQGTGVLIGTDQEPVMNIEVESWIAERLGVSKDKENDWPPDPRGKRCSNQKLLELGFNFKYPDYKIGYQALIEPL